MSEAAIFEYPYGVFLMKRLEFVLLTRDELEAMIMRIVEYEMIKLKEEWQNRVAVALEEKKTPPVEPKEYWVRLSHNQIITKLYCFNTKKVGAKHPLSISEATLRKRIDSLIYKKGFLLSRSKQGDEFGAPMYTLNRTAIQDAMSHLPENPFGIFLGLTNFEPPHLQNLEVGDKNFEGGDINNLEVPPSKNESPTSSNLTSEVQNPNLFKDRDKISSQEEGKEYIAALAPSLSNTSLLDDFDLTDKDLSVEEEDITEAPTVKAGAVKAETPDLSEEDTPRPAIILPPLPPAQDPSSCGAGTQEPGQAAPEDTDTESHSQPELSNYAPPLPARQSAKQEPKAEPTWSKEAMVSLSERLRDLPYTEVARPKELKKAEKLLKRCPECTPEEFERVFRRVFNEWWLKHQGRGSITELVAIAPNKNDWRYMLEVEKIELEKKRSSVPSTSASKPSQPRLSDDHPHSFAAIKKRQANKMAALYASMPPEEREQ